MTEDPARTTPIDATTVNGWGVDADPENDPTYPYRQREKDDHSGKWQRPPVQHTDIEVLQSIEHKQRPATFGTSSPPSGLSGSMRRLAFRWSESNLMHWLLLMGADRVNVVEGIGADLLGGKVPNVPAEMGARAEWDLNKRGLVKKTAIAAALTGVAVLLVARSRQRA